TRAIWGRSSVVESARLSGERPPVRVRSSPFHGGRGVDGSTRGRDPRRRRFESGRPPLPHPWGCSSTGEHLACNEEGVGSTPTVSTSPPWCQRHARALCTAEVRVRLLPEAPFHVRAQSERALPCDGGAAGSTPAGRDRGRSSSGRAPGR